MSGSMTGIAASVISAVGFALILAGALVAVNAVESAFSDEALLADPEFAASSAAASLEAAAGSSLLLIGFGGLLQFAAFVTWIVASVFLFLGISDLNRWSERHGVGTVAGTGVFVTGIVLTVLAAGVPWAATAVAGLALGKVGSSSGAKIAAVSVAAPVAAVIGLGVSATMGDSLIGDAFMLAAPVLMLTALIMLRRDARDVVSRLSRRHSAALKGAPPAGGVPAPSPATATDPGLIPAVPAAPVAAAPVPVSTRQAPPVMAPPDVIPVEVPPTSPAVAPAAPAPVTSPQVAAPEPPEPVVLPMVAPPLSDSAVFAPPAAVVDATVPGAEEHGPGWPPKPKVGEEYPEEQWITAQVAKPKKDGPGNDG
jgi:hypothetical protein